MALSNTVTHSMLVERKGLTVPESVVEGTMVVLGGGVRILPVNE